MPTNFQTGQIQVNDEPWVHRLITHSESGEEDAFRDGVRTRDGMCVISGVPVVNAEDDDWTGYHAAHIFPLSSDSCTIGDSGHWITHIPGTSKINSPQNGLLLLSHIHEKFDQYIISVNPDVSSLHTVICLLLKIMLNLLNRRITKL